jgi:hypothetical protein
MHHRQLAPRPRRTASLPAGTASIATARISRRNCGRGRHRLVRIGREVYVSPYSVSLSYVRNINVSNTRMNTTVINNVYDTIVFNKKTVDITYVNRAVPGAVTATSTQAFAAAQPVERTPILDVGQSASGQSVSSERIALLLSVSGRTPESIACATGGDSSQPPPRAL